MMSMKPEDNVQVNVDRTQVVTFFDEGERSQNVITSVAPENNFLAPGRDKITHSVRGFLSRPVEIQNFNWSLASSWGTQIGQDIHLPATWLGIDMIREKMAGFLYMKCNFRVRVQVNAQPFHAGRLLLVYLPVEKQQTYIPTNELHFGGVTGYRCVDLDLSENTSADIVVPFNANISHFDLVKAIGLLGAVRIYVYSALTGTTDVDGTIWLSAEDVEIEMPSGLAPAARGEAHSAWTGENGERLIKKKGEDLNKFYERVGGYFDYEDEIGEEQPETEPVARDEIEQAQPQTAPVQIEEEKKAEKKNPGIISKVAKTVAKTAQALSWVPVIGTVSSVVGFVSEAVSGVASLFGWSKPVDIRTSLPVVPLYARNLGNYDGDSKRKTAAFASTNEVVHPSNVFDTDVDEMSLNAILRKPVFLDRFNFTDVNVANQVIWRWPVSPAACGKNTYTLNGVEHRIKLNTYLSYLSEMFSMWRGSINYHFKIIKTKFHTGRIRVSYIPSMYEGTPLSLLDINKVYTKVFDIRELTHFSFNVPFVFHQPWNSLKPIEELKGQYSETIPTGIILVEVLNPLKFPSTAANSIEFIVETSAGVDFQFAYPTVRGEYSVLPSTTSTNISGSALNTILDNTRKLNVVERIAVLGKSNNITSLIKQFKPAITEVKKEKEKEKPGSNSEQPKTDIVGSKVVTVSDIVPIGKENLVPDADGFVLDPELNKLPLSTAPHSMQTLIPKPKFRYMWEDFASMWDDFASTNRDKDNVDNFRVMIRRYPVDAPAGAPWKGAADSKALTRLKQLLEKDKIVGYVHSKFFSGPEAKDVSVNAFGVGEIVTSLRQLLKRYSWMVNKKKLPGKACTAYYPFVTSAHMNQVFFPADVGTEFNTFFDRISYLYRWMSGSVNVGIYAPDGEDSMFTISPGWDGASLPSTSRCVDQDSVPPLSRYDASAVQVPFFPSQEKFVEIGVPFYQRNPAILTGVGLPTPTDLDSSFEYVPDCVPNNYGTKLIMPSAYSYEIYQSIGEDFSFGYLIGPPISISNPSWS